MKELAGRAVKLNKFEYKNDEVPFSLVGYLDSAHQCVNPKCKGMLFMKTKTATKEKQSFYYVMFLFLLRCLLRSESGTREIRRFLWKIPSSSSTIFMFSQMRYPTCLCIHRRVIGW